jgi:hypothetical protein
MIGSNSVAAATPNLGESQETAKPNQPRPMIQPLGSIRVGGEARDGRERHEGHADA